MQAIQTVFVISAAIFLVGLLFWRAWRIFHPKPSPFDNAFLFFGLVFLAMLALRWAGIVYPAERNVDESQMVAQAMRFLSHPVPWRDVDSTTSGPLNSLLLSVPIRCGAPPTWQTARLVLLAANYAVILLIYFSLRHFVGRPEAQFTLMPLLFFYAFTTSWDYTHYSSETLSIVLLSAGFYLLVKQWRTGVISKTGMFFLGVLLGAIPFAKLQAAPLATFLGAAALALIFARPRLSEKPVGNRAAQCGALILGAVLVPALILGIVARSGAFGDFWTSYILSTRKDAATEHVLSTGRFQGMPWWAKRIMYLGYILLTPSNLGVYFLSGVGALVVLWGIYRSKKTPFQPEVRTPLAIMIVYGVLAILCIFTAGKPFAHYGNLMIIPLAGLTGLAFIAGKTTLDIGGQMGFVISLPRVHWLVAFTILAILPQAYLGPFRVYRPVSPADDVSELWVPSVSKLALPASRPGDTLSIWGWMPQCHVQMGLAPATRDAVCHYAVSGPYMEYYRNRYLEDLKLGKPAIIIDAVGDGGFPAYTQWTAAQRHENFPELAKFIDDSYSLYTSVELRPQTVVGAVRIYVLKERMAELHLSPANPGAPPVNDFPPDSLPDWAEKHKKK